MGSQAGDLSLAGDFDAETIEARSSIRAPSINVPTITATNISATNISGTNVTGSVVTSITDTNVGQHLNVTNDATIGGALDVGGAAIIGAGAVLLGSTPTSPAILQGAFSPNGVLTASRGTLFLRTDAAQLWQNTDGISAWSQVGSGSGLFNASLSTPAPTAANTGFQTWWYQLAGATYVDGACGPLINTPANGGLTRFTARSKPAPATPYTITMLLSGVFPLTASAAGTFYAGWGEAATGTANKGDVVLLFPSQSVQTYRYLLTNATTLSSNPQLNTALLQQPTMMWWRLRDDGTTATIAWSTTGDPDSFQALYTVTKAGSFLGAAGYNHLLFGCTCNPGTGMVQLLSFKQTTP